MQLEKLTGKILIFMALILLLIGLVLYFGGDKLNWLGKLPGDIRIEKEHFNVYIPITTMILISVVLSLVLYIAKKLF